MGDNLHTLPIGEVLVRIGAMTRAQLETVLDQQRTEPDKLFGQIAIELGFIDDDAITAYIDLKTMLAGREGSGVPSGKDRKES